jgi:hypothetical protein
MFSVKNSIQIRSVVKAARSSENLRDLQQMPSGWFSTDVEACYELIQCGVLNSLGRNPF